MSSRGRGSTCGSPGHRRRGGRRTVVLDGASGRAEVGYDTLVHALGSHGADHGVPGRPRSGCASGWTGCVGGRVLVVGDGLTGIETALEIAETRPGLGRDADRSRRTRRPLSAGACAHLRRACDRLGIAVLQHVTVTAVEAVAGTVCRRHGPGGRRRRVDGWVRRRVRRRRVRAGGHGGRIVVDRTMRSVSHPDVYAVGDSVFTLGDNGLPRRCPARRPVLNAKLPYVGNHISLGRRDGILQMVDGGGWPSPATPAGIRPRGSRPASSGCRCGRPSPRRSVCRSAGTALPRRRTGRPRRRASWRRACCRRAAGRPRMADSSRSPVRPAPRATPEGAV
ncbi:MULTISPECIES: FAD-dependent oxidoreductase [Streptomyces]|uniref:FAD-dependent oxidoreductase n=1 Tax=Streptomyces TaxID=1883 RepID=UPI0034DE5050